MARMPPENAVRFRVDPQMRRQLDRLRREKSRQRLGLGAPPGQKSPERRVPRRGARRGPDPRAARRASRASRRAGPRPETSRRSRDGHPASSTRVGAPCSKARRWPPCPRATSCAARRSSSPTAAATPGPRPSPTSSAEQPPRSWSPIPAGRAGEAARRESRPRPAWFPGCLVGGCSRPGTGHCST